MQSNFRNDDTIVRQEERGIRLRSELPWEARIQLPHLPTPEDAKSGGCCSHSEDKTFERTRENKKLLRKN